MSLRERVRVEIYEGDPFAGCCGPGIASKKDVDKLRNILIERNHIIKTLKEEFKDRIEIERDIISAKRRLETYPKHIYKLLTAGTKVPFIVINGKLSIEGKFPTLEEFKCLINEHII
ncbi:MAG: hypothetical protein QXD04_03855 [Candidatus Bathyarchaeia archaeon]